MRLLHRKGDQLELCEFPDNKRPSYAILSHVRGEDEVTMQDVEKNEHRNKRGYRKIQLLLDRASADNLHYCWVDTGCVDETNKAEVKYTISQMFTWYKQASKCYAILSDVPAVPFGDSRWFKRGWTLQELIAPTDVEFFSGDNTSLGTKHSMVKDLAQITEVPARALLNCPLSEFSFKERLTWTTGRETTVEEDKIYSMLGILGVTMEPNYGEGMPEALRRVRKVHRNASREKKPTGESLTEVPQSSQVHDTDRRYRLGNKRMLHGVTNGQNHVRDDQVALRADILTWPSHS